MSGWMNLPLTLLAAVLWCSQVLAIAPRYITDAELAKYPVIVIAKWEKAPFVQNHRYITPDKGSVDRVEAYTRLTILEVIRGDVKPGEVELKTGWGIAWDREGKNLSTGSSTELPGDVDDITEPAIWFLQRERSWDEARKEEYLSVSNYREVQPIELREFYETMIRPDADRIVSGLLSIEHSSVTNRVLKHLCGGSLPWPYEADLFFYLMPPKRGLLLKEEADRVWEFIEKNPGKPRANSVSVYAELRGKECVHQVRTLLRDGDAMVRGVAVGILARHRDAASADQFAEATRDLEDGWLCCQLIKELSAWENDDAIPALFGFLRNDSFAYQLGDDIGIPALLAKKALLGRTGHEFPYDVELSRNAWEKTKNARDKSERLKLLAELAPGGKCPIRAVAFGRPSSKISEDLKARIGELSDGEQVVQVRLSNISSKSVTILKRPSMISEDSASRSSAYSGDFSSAEHKREYITLGPNESHVIEVRASAGLLGAGRTKGKLTFEYRSNGASQGVNAWIGSVQVEIGEAVRE